jgi:squalene synthase HpnC
VLVGLQPTLRDCRLQRQPFVDLIDANRQDQIVKSYATWDDLLGYCTLSANPVGRIVLAIFGAGTPERNAWSDNVCTGLQVVEHLQDVGEDARRARVYLPQEILDRFSCTAADLLRPAADDTLRAAVAEVAARARRLLSAGRPLARSLRGRPRWAVAGFCGGGLAALDSITAAGHDVLSQRVRPARSAIVRRTTSIAWGRST